MLQTLSQTRPVLLGGIDMIQSAVDAELGAREDYFSIDLQKNSAFHKLMQSRFLQFFVWSDLMKYAKSSPFYLRIHNPRSLTLAHTDTSSTLTTSLGVSAVMQSYRDSTWWSYVVMSGTAKASIAVSLADGTLSYSTKTSSPSISMNYGSDYVSKYGKPSSIPKSRLISSLEGPQADLSGKMKFDDISLDAAGKYRASTLKWLSPQTFAITWNELN